jgi:hypothetical protein
MQASRVLLALVVGCLGLTLSGCRDDAGDAVDRSAGSPSSTSRPTPAAPTKDRRASHGPRAGATHAVPSPSITVPELAVPPSLSGAVAGGDVSWPQCPKGMGIPEKRSLGLPMPLSSARFVVLGLTNGPGFTPNPCLASQVAWVQERHLMAAAYAVNSYPDAGAVRRYGSDGPYDGTTRLGALRNVGYQQALFNVGTMRAAGLQSPIIWLDVEPVPGFAWSVDTEANAAVVVGAARGYVDAGYQIGAYSTQALWATVVGSLRLGVPEWRPAGQTSRAEALSRCGEDRMFQGGHGVLAQWVQDSRDLDVTCPGTSAELYKWFHQY